MVFWALYRGNYAAEWWLNNGVEVTATGVRWGEGYIWRDDADGHSYREHYYYCVFEYESEDGKLYVVKPWYKYRETAEASVGTQRKILIDPNGTKVRYYDNGGRVQESWAREWFTRREAEFLKEKKYITVVPYKGTYGILEKMPTVKKAKKSIKYE